jgi:hypothetical protein
VPAASPAAREVPADLPAGARKVPAVFPSGAGAFAAEDTSPCVPGAETLCLNDGRFEVRVDWETFQAATGVGQAIPLTSDTGYFWFFDPDNVEMVIKVLDGCGVNGSFWVYAGGLTDVETRITVRDSESGLVWQAVNPQLTPFQPIQDVNAFPACP